MGIAHCRNYLTRRNYFHPAVRRCCPLGRLRLGFDTPGRLLGVNPCRLAPAHPAYPDRRFGGPSVEEPFDRKHYLLPNSALGDQNGERLRNLCVLPTSLVTQRQSLSHVGSVTPRSFRWLDELRFVHCPLELKLHFVVQGGTDRWLLFSSVHDICLDDCDTAYLRRFLVLLDGLQLIALFHMGS